MNAVWSAVLNGSIASVPLAMAAWLTLRLTPRRVLNAATRYVIWWAVLALTLALPCFFRTGHTVHRATADAGAVTLQVLEVGTGVARSTLSPRSLPLEVRGGSWMRWLAAVWIAASCLLLLRLLLSYRTIRRADARAVDIPQAAIWWGHIPYRIAKSTVVPVPVAIGPIRRAILIPAGLLDRLPESSIGPIILHEAAHLARRDDCTLLLERLLEALFSLHPVVRWVTRQIDLEREIACDDVVVEATGGTHHYAECLTRAMALCGAVRGSLAGAHAGGNRPHLSRRVELLLDEKRQTHTRIRALRLSIFAAALMSAAFLLASLPGPLTFAAQPKEIAMKSHTARKLVVATAAAAAIAATTASAQAARPQAAGQSTQAQTHTEKRMLVLYFDSTTLTQADHDRAVAAASKFVQNQMKPNDVVAVMMSAGAVAKVLQDFTGDSNLLLNAIQRVSDVRPTGTSAALPSDEAAVQQNDRRLANLRSVVNMLGVLPEKKALVYFMAGMTRTTTDNPGQLQETIDAAVRANVAFYPIDPQGLIQK